jgi:hypothetical protein
VQTPPALLEDPVGSECDKWNLIGNGDRCLHTNHASGAQEVLDNEDRNFLVDRDYERTLYPRFYVDEMVSTLPPKDKSIPLEDSDEG